MNKTVELIVDDRPCENLIVSNNNNKTNNNNTIAIVNGGTLGDMIGADGCAKKEIGVLVIGNGGGGGGGVVAGTRKEDEKITTAVMKVLQGYQWSLVPTTTK